MQFGLMEAYTSRRLLVEVVATRAGRCFGVVQWLRLELVEGLVYENHPDPSGRIDSWGHMLHRFAEPI